MIDDPIVTEVRKRRTEFTQRFDNDPHKIIRYFQKKQAVKPEKYVSEVKVVPAGELAEKK
ncbi:MAG: hypothetical protein QME64_10820 [bacterium]|nr:hypothetical protein [bacterium]